MSIGRSGSLPLPKNVDSAPSAAATGTDIPMSELLPFCSKDKKRESNTLNYIVCNEIGKAEIVKTTVDGFAALMEGK